MLRGQNVFIRQVFTNALTNCLNCEKIKVNNLPIYYLSYQLGFEPL